MRLAISSHPGLTGRSSIILAVAGLTLVWLAWCLYFLPLGVDFTDEGYYCSEAWRFSQGDLPFRDSLGGSGLSFWYLSWVLRAFPDCGLLGLRIVWWTVMLACAYLTAFLLMRHFSVVSSFAGATMGLLFASAGAIKVLSYNTMPIPWLLLTVWLWLAACDAQGRRQLLYAAGAGLAAFIATTCRISLLPVVLLPLVSVLYDALCGINNPNRVRTVCAFWVLYGLGIVAAIAGLHWTGLSEDFWLSLTLTTEVPGHSMASMVHFLGRSLRYYLWPGVAMLAVYVVARRRQVAAGLAVNARLLWYSVGAIVMATVALVVVLLLRHPAYVRGVDWITKGIHELSLDPGKDPSHYSTCFLIAVALGVLLVLSLHHVLHNRLHGTEGRTCERGKVYLLAIAASLLMIPGTNVSPAASVKTMSFLSVGLVLSWGWALLPFWEQVRVNRSTKWFSRALLVFACGVYLFYALVPSLYPYRDSYAPALTTRLTTPKLSGIATTYERATVIDQLVESVIVRSKPNDRIMAYEHLPMLYYLTDRLPATCTSWLSEDRPASFRQYCLEDMVERDRVPALVVRATYSTLDTYWPQWRSPLGWTKRQRMDDPIETYVRSHYEVVEEVGGFQIMLPAVSRPGGDTEGRDSE